MALPQVDGDMRPSMLLDKMRALTPPEELERPTSLFWHAFLMRLLSDINVNCVLFLGVETLADVARRADTQFGARPSLLRCHRSTAFPRSCASMASRSLQPSRKRSMPPRPGPGPRPSRRSSAITMPASAVVPSNVKTLPLDDSPGKLQGQELKSRHSCPNPPLSSLRHPSPSSSSSPLSSSRSSSSPSSSTSP